VVEGFVCGVFEGGGAKGVLYPGALEGMLRRKLWFSAVAGSSAGAITAAMIAAGMTPAEMRQEMDDGLVAMGLPTRWSGYRRIRWGTGFLDHEAIYDWLSRLLYKKLEPDVLGTGATFADLFARTEIDLFVVAVDLRARHLAVFNRALTPQIEVAEAVMASATIPFALEPRLFHYATPEGRPRWRMFVDGGVASNFPSFVFQDEAFRVYSGLDPVPEDTRIVGFLLDEERSPELERREESTKVYGEGAFIGRYFNGFAMLRSALDEDAKPINEPRFRPARTRRRLRHVRRALALVELVVLTFITLLGRAIQYSTPRDAFTWNWRVPSRPRARLWLNAGRPWLAPSAIPLILGVATYTGLFWVGFAFSLGYVVPGIAESSVAGTVVGALVALVAYVFAIAVWLLGLVMFLFARATHRSVSVLGNDILDTYLNTSAPPWAGSASNERVIRLRVPPGIKTLRIGECADVEGALADAEQTTFEELADVPGKPFPARPQID
jgi:predicted acylesterase/phospholipase RssA